MIAPEYSSENLLAYYNCRMEITQIADYIGETGSAYAYLAIPSNSLKEHITKLLLELRSDIGPGLYAMPKEALHITLCEIFQAKDYSQDKQHLFDMSRKAFEDIPADILKHFSPIKIIFNKIEASPYAIIIRGEDDGSFKKIRKQLLKRLPIPLETKAPPDIIHISIARFTERLDLTTVGKLAGRHSINQEEIIQDFRLIHTTVFPFNQYSTIRKYPLSK